MADQTLRGRVAIVTGGSRGLGLQIAEAYAEQGARLALTARKAAQLADAQARLRDRGARVLTVPGNLAEPGHAQALVDRVIDAWGTIDVLVNNAAFQLHAAKIEDISDAHLQETLQTNIAGYFHMARAAVPQWLTLPPTPSLPSAAASGLACARQLSDIR